MRPTPSSGGLVRRTPDEASVAIVDARARIGAARALAHLVQQLSDGALSELDSDQSPEVRETLRQFVARTRHASFAVRVAGDAMSIDGAPLDATLLLADALLAALHRTLIDARVSFVSVREGAAPGELLTLARLLASRHDANASRAEATTRTPGNAELLRTWSVLVLAAWTSTTPIDTTTVPPSARLVNLRTDEAARRAVTTMINDVDQLVARRDADALERIAHSLAHAIDNASTGGGRLAFEEGFRRLLRNDVIELLASRIPDGRDRRASISVFARAGETGVRALLDGLMQAPDALARRSCFDTIVAIDLGGSLLREALADERWFVVRNTAALIAEMGIADADVELIRLLANTDDRIRIAAARALIRLRTPRALTGLHAAVDDGNAEVRRIAATSYTLAITTAGSSRPTAGKLAAALDRETDEDVALEMMAAMGRLGSADAVQRLLRIAQSPTIDSPAAIGAADRGYTPRPSWIRIAALEALVDARGAAVTPAVEALTRDQDELVAGAARGML